MDHQSASEPRLEQHSGEYITTRGVSAGAAAEQAPHLPDASASDSSAQQHAVGDGVPAASSSSAADAPGDGHCRPCEEERSLPTDGSDDEENSDSSDGGEADVHGGAAFRGGPRGWCWDFGDHRPRRSRRDDASLAVRARALNDLRRHLADGGGQTRLAQSSRASKSMPPSSRRSMTDCGTRRDGGW